MWKKNSMLMILLLAIADRAVAASDYKGIKKFNIENYKSVGNNLFSKKNAGKLTLCFIAGPSVSPLLGGYFLSKWIRKKRRGKRREVMYWVLQYEYVRADIVRKSKICTRLFGVSEQEMVKIIVEVQKIRREAIKIEKKQCGRKIYPIPEGQTLEIIVKDE